MSKKNQPMPKEAYDFVLVNYKIMTINEMANKLNCSPVTINKIKSKLNVANKSTFKQVNANYDYNCIFLQNNYLSMTNQELANKLGSSEGYVNRLLKKLGLIRRNAIDKQREEFVLKNYMSMSIRKMAEILNVDKSVINNIKKRLNLNGYAGHKKKEKVIPDYSNLSKYNFNSINEKLEFIRQNYKQYTDDELAYQCGCTRSNIEQLRLTNKLYRGNPTGYRYTYFDETLLYPDEVFVNMDKIGFSLYDISNYGRVKNIKTNQILSQRINPDGYVVTSLKQDDGKYTNKLVHVLVALMFIENDDPDHKTEVNHINGRKDKPYVTELEWQTPSGNVKHAFRTGLMNNHVGENNSATKYTNDDIRAICELLQKGYTPIEILKEMPKFTKSLIYNIRSRKNWTSISKNYTF